MKRFAFVRCQLPTVIWNTQVSPIKTKPTNPEHHDGSFGLTVIKKEKNRTKKTKKPPQNLINVTKCIFHPGSVNVTFMGQQEG